MRSWAARALLKNTSRVIVRTRVYPQVPRNSYCSACDASAPVQAKPKLQTTANPPIPPADHRQLGIDQQLFTTSVYSPGSPLFLPNGTKIFNSLTGFLRAQYALFGFQEVITPNIYKKSLWEKSGHWENYAKDMYSVVGRGAGGGKLPTGEMLEGGKELEVGEDEEFGLKPMNCPGHCLIFSSQKRSYRDLPIRYADFSPLHRNEISGALSGLTRVRRFHQDDGHIFCRPAQIQAEIASTLQFIKLTYNVLKLGPYRLALSTRPKDHFIGTVEEWENAENQLRASLDGSGMEWVVEEGEGAFYGPKIDIILKDSDGKEHQTATIQLDFQLPKRFDLTYQAPAPELEQKGQTTTDAALLEVQGNVRPVMIHRAVLGSVERIMALLIEHHKGKWPFWLNPRQVIILTINDTLPVIQFAKEAQEELAFGENYLNKHGVMPLESKPFSVDIDDSARSLGKKIREAKKLGYSIVVVVGPNDVTAKHVSVDFTAINVEGLAETADTEGINAQLDGAREVSLASGKATMRLGSLRSIMKSLRENMI